MNALLVSSALGLMLVAGPVSAQTDNQQAADQQAPAPSTAQPPAPFPEGAKVAYINIQRIANESSEGRAAATKLKTFQDKKLAELAERQKTLAANQEKLQKSGSVLSEQARAQLEKDIDKGQVDMQRAQQDAQAELQDLQRDVELDFQRKLVPVIDTVAQEKGLNIVLGPESGIVWAHPGLDITTDVIKRFDAANPAAKPQQ